MTDNSRLLQPLVLQTKEELLNALKQGQLKTSKYNLLTDLEKLYVELVCFGGYSGEQAMRAIDPNIKSPKAAANRIMANPDVQATIEELTIARDKKFQAEIQSNRDLAMQKLMYIMSTTQDENLAVNCAKIIMDKAENATKNITQKDEQVGQIKFNIQVENMYTGPSMSRQDPVILELAPEDIDPSIKEAKQINENLKKENEELEEKLDKAEVNPYTGLKYTLLFEGVDNYTDK